MLSSLCEPEWRFRCSFKISLLYNCHSSFTHLFLLKSKIRKKQLSLSVVGCLLGDNGRWRWQCVPLCASLGLKIEPKNRKDCFLNLHLIPHFHLKLLTPIFGKLGEILYMFAFSKCFQGSLFSLSY